MGVEMRNAEVERERGEKVCKNIILSLILQKNIHHKVIRRESYSLQEQDTFILTANISQIRVIYGSFNFYCVGSNNNGSQLYSYLIDVSTIIICI